MVEDVEFPWVGLLKKKSMWKFQGSLEQEVAFPRVFKKKSSCVISMGLGGL